MTKRALALLLLLVPALLSAQDQDNRVFYYAKPLERAVWQPPMKPVTRLADVKVRHKGEPGWRELVIHDENSRAFLVQEPAWNAQKHARRLYPDSPAWWAVLDGRIRFEVETRDRRFEVFEATKGSYVFVPERMLHGFEVVGDQPAIAFEVTLASATPVYPERPATAPPGAKYIPVRLSTGPHSRATIARSGLAFAIRAGARKPRHPTRPAALRCTSRRSQTITGFQLAQFWSTNTPNPFAVNNLPLSLAALALRSPRGWLAGGSFARVAADAMTHNAADRASARFA